MNDDYKHIMTLSNNNLEESIDTSIGTRNRSTNLDSLYCSHLWSSSYLCNPIINEPSKDNQLIKYCYTCKGKIRKYELNPISNFIPDKHSTPNGKIQIELIEQCNTELRESVSNDNFEGICSYSKSYVKESENTEVDNEHIPSISRQVDSSFRQKFTSYEMHSNPVSQRRLRKSLKGIGCIVNLALTDSAVKKRTKIQACSISVMIIAIVLISFVLVNFTTPNFTRATNINSTILVPTDNIYINETPSAITNVYTDEPLDTAVNVTAFETTTKYISIVTIENTSPISSILSKIRKNIRTYPKDASKKQDSPKPKDINNRDLSQRFCSCQNNEICMLDENTGTSICRQAIDSDDPTGCGGLCALETEACHLVDKERGVRVCRLLTLVTCSTHQWRCRNGLCVPAEARCDGSIQCYDRSDEMHCDCDLAKQFRCGHAISCFPNDKLCDGNIDCWDGFDEVNCTTECPKEQFTCTDGQCILSLRFCDGFVDCADGSDEPNGCGGACGKHETQCKNHRCISNSVLCDGDDNCGDSTDEQDCP